VRDWMSDMADQPLEYDAFLSYAHRDRQVATAIQKGLHQIGRRFGQLRALRVFRDDTNLAASPDLWGKIVEALDRSGHMIVVLSPQAAASHWVNEEIGHWLGQRGGEKLMLVLADGRLQWDPAGKRFDPAGSDAAPPALTQPGSLQSEPLYIDVSDDSPWDLRSLTFRDKVTALAAPVHGKPKDQLAGDDLREQRRFRRLRAAAVAGLALLTVVAVVAAGLAFAQRQEAVRRLRDAVTAKLNSEGAAMLAGLTPGGDIRGIQELLAANAVQSNGVPILDAQIARFTTRKIVDTGAQPLGLSFSPDGRRIVTSESNGAVRQWDSATGKSVGPHIAGHTDVASAVAYAPDGRTIASTGADNTLRLWDAVSGKPLNPKPPPANSAKALAISPDGTLIVTGGEKNVIRLWDAHNGQLLKSVQAAETRTGHIDQLAFDRTGDWFAAAVQDKVAMYDSRSFALRRPPIKIGAADATRAIFGVAISPDGHTIATGGDNINLLNADNGDVIRTIPLATSQLGTFATAVAFSPDGNRIASGRIDGAVQLWDAHTGVQIGPTLLGQNGESNAVAFNPDGLQLASVNMDGTLRLWNADLGQPMRGPAPDLIKVAISPDGRRVGAFSNPAIEQWDTTTGQALPTLVARDVPFKAFVFVDGARIVTAAADGTIQTWNAVTGEPVQSPVHIDNAVNNSRFAFSADGTTVAVADDDHAAVQLWSATTGRNLGPPMTVTNPANTLYDMTFSPDGHHLAVGYSDGVRLWNTATRRLDHTISTLGKLLKPIASVAFSRDGTVLAGGGATGEIMLWDSSTFRPLPHSPLPHQIGFAIGLAFGPGHQLASAGTDATLRLWDTATGAPTATPLKRADAVTGVALSPDGRLAASTSFDGAMQLSPALADPAQLCDKLPANMSRKQWRDWVSPGIDYIQVCPGLPIAPD
jgi:WD40 repeat protein